METTIDIDIPDQCLGVVQAICRTIKDARRCLLDYRMDTANPKRIILIFGDPCH